MSVHNGEAMGLIRKKLKVSGSKTVVGSDEACLQREALFDTGTSACFVRREVAEELSQLLRSPSPLVFKLGDGSSLKVEHTTVLHTDIKGHTLAHMFLVVPELPYEMIIGADFLQRWKIRLDPTTEDFIIDERALEMVLV